LERRIARLATKSVPTTTPDLPDPTAEQRNRFLRNLRIVQQAQNLVERIVLLAFSIANGLTEPK